MGNMQKIAQTTNTQSTQSQDKESCKLIEEIYELLVKVYPQSFYKRNDKGIRRLAKDYYREIKKGIQDDFKSFYDVVKKQFQRKSPLEALQDYKEFLENKLKIKNRDLGLIAKQARKLANEFQKLLLPLFQKEFKTFFFDGGNLEMDNNNPLRWIVYFLEEELRKIAKDIKEQGGAAFSTEMLEKKQQELEEMLGGLRFRVSKVSFFWGNKNYLDFIRALKYFSENMKLECLVDFVFCQFRKNGWNTLIGDVDFRLPRELKFFESERSRLEEDRIRVKEQLGIESYASKKDNEDIQAIDRKIETLDFPYTFTELEECYPETMHWVREYVEKYFKGLLDVKTLQKIEESLETLTKEVEILRDKQKELEDTRCSLYGSLEYEELEAEIDKIVKGLMESNHKELMDEYRTLKPQVSNGELQWSNKIDQEREKEANQREKEFVKNSLEAQEIKQNIEKLKAQEESAREKFEAIRVLEVERHKAELESLKKNSQETIIALEKQKESIISSDKSLSEIYKKYQNTKGLREKVEEFRHDLDTLNNSYREKRKAQGEVRKYKDRLKGNLREKEKEYYEKKINELEQKITEYSREIGSIWNKLERFIEQFTYSNKQVEKELKKSFIKTYEILQNGFENKEKNKNEWQFSDWSYGVFSKYYINPKNEALFDSICNSFWDTVGKLYKYPKYKEITDKIFKVKEDYKKTIRQIEHNIQCQTFDTQEYKEALSAVNDYRSKTWEQEQKYHQLINDSLWEGRGFRNYFWFYRDCRFDNLRQEINNLWSEYENDIYSNTWHKYPSLQKESFRVFLDKEEKIQYDESQKTKREAIDTKIELLNTKQLEIDKEAKEILKLLPLAIDICEVEGVCSDRKFEQVSFAKLTNEIMTKLWHEIRDTSKDRGHIIGIYTQMYKLLNLLWVDKEIILEKKFREHKEKIIKAITKTFKVYQNDTIKEVSVIGRDEFAREHNLPLNDSVLRDIMSYLCDYLGTTYEVFELFVYCGGKRYEFDFSIIPFLSGEWDSQNENFLYKNTEIFLCMTQHFNLYKKLVELVEELKEELKKKEGYFFLVEGKRDKNGVVNYYKDRKYSKNEEKECFNLKDIGLSGYGYMDKTFDFNRIDLRY